ncbi:inositol 1,4,5-triphosphate receptor associated 2 isoform X4 [Nerophis ophidion]|uniref:inositol 1,4,5-triphosphate receptor associated 2 isoform X4 n=1 Tax=Nerophis ophidion TaxID=159077 RepID=UPI002AE09A41|nr:inositol 1,4,5-triphosphate receptor associated 2 isoform X4 [Nerophis ophidion]
MDYYIRPPRRRHNPVDSICRKLQTIRWRGDREPNSPFQIPKLSSSSFDSPQCGLRRDLEAILKKGARCNDQHQKMPSSAHLQNNNGPPVPPCTPASPSPTPANVTYTITSTFGSDVKPFKAWQRCCSTPSGHSKDSPSSVFTGSRAQTTFTPSPSTGTGTRSYCLNFSSANTGNSSDSDLPYPALVVKRLSLVDGGDANNMAEVSLICEENLLDTIFHACDTQRRGKVYVSHIVDYLRHTTSRHPEDSGLEDLCNMLDPERKDVSIDLDTYHAIMREWIDDCRNNGEEEEEAEEEDVTQDSIKQRDTFSAKRSMLLNMTSGSLEGFGGDASRAEFETSELVCCVADLQMGNKKLQEEVKKLKQAAEAMEESNLRLAEENQELRGQARVLQQAASTEKMLKEEVEEMKATLSCTEEGRARASAHCKHVEKEKQGLMADVASLQEENYKVSVAMDKLHKRIAELCDINADLQLQVHSSDAAMGEKEALIREKSRQIDELKAAVEEYSSITELLRADKSKLETQMQMIHPDLAGAAVSLSVAYRLNQSTCGSLQTELALAQSPLESVDHFSGGGSFASPLDEMLDREVLLMMQGSSPDRMALEFKTLVKTLKTDFSHHTSAVQSSLKALVDQGHADGSLQAQLDAWQEDCALGLDRLARYTDCIEKELIKMAGNLRRSRAEILHLSVRVQEQQNQKRQLCEELKTPQESREASCQTPVPEETGEDLEWDEEYALQDFLKKEIAVSNCRVQDHERESNAEEAPKGAEEDDDAEKWMVVDGTGDGEVRDTSTPVSAGRGQTEVKPHCLQEEAEAPSSYTHSQAGSHQHLQADAHSEEPDADPRETAWSQPAEAIQDVNASPGQDPAVMLSDDVTSHPASVQLTGEDPEESDTTKSLTPDHLTPTAAAEDTARLLPVVVEEEESVQESSTAAPTEAASVAGTEQPTALTAAGRQQSSVTQSSQSESSMTSDPGQVDCNGKTKNELEQSHDSVDAPKVEESKVEVPAAPEREAESSTICDQGDACREDKTSLSASDKEIEKAGQPTLCAVFQTEFQRLALGFKCDMFTLDKRLRLEERSRDLAEENVRREVSSCQGLLQALTPLCEDDNQSMEIIHRLQKNLDILIQSMTRVSSRSEMLGAIHQESRIGKAVEVMIQHVENLRRVYTKEHAELLELRETLMHNERSFGSHTDRGESFKKNNSKKCELTWGLLADELRGKKPPTSQYYKSSSRRVSIAAIPRSAAGNMHYDMSKQQDGADSEAERVTRRAPWNAAGKNMARPPLKRFVSSAAWVDTEDPSGLMKGTARHTSDPQCGEEPEEPVAEKRRSSLSELGSRLTSFILPLKTLVPLNAPPDPSSSSSPASSDPAICPSLPQALTSSRMATAARGNRGLWLWLAMVLVLAGLVALLASLVMQPAVEAAPVGTGDSWVTIQQLLWPYAGLRHNGQPPV